MTHNQYTSTVRAAARFLAVSPDSSLEEITSAWRSVLRNHHPDTHQSTNAAWHAAMTRTANAARSLLLANRSVASNVWALSRQFETEANLERDLRPEASRLLPAVTSATALKAQRLFDLTVRNPHGKIDIAA